MAFYNLDKDKAFLVSQKALIVEQNKLLILKNTDDESDRISQWELPGGLLELNESLPLGLFREVKEETGLDIVIGKIAAAWEHWEYGFKVQDGRILDIKIVGIAFFCQKTGVDIQLSHEHQQYRWATKPELQQLDLALNSKCAIEKYLIDTSF